MARSMIRRRQEAARQRIEAYEASLRRASAARRPPPDFETALNEVKKGFESEILRDAFAWRPRLKTRDGARLRLAAARHLFALYPVPAHLEQIWLETDGLDATEIVLRKRWYVTVARGDSLYKAVASQWLSRKEVHWFLHPPGDLAFREAFWVAIARGYTDDLGVALRLARSKVAATPRSELAFWREAARFFCANPAPLERIDDLCDYLAVARRGGFSLKGRTLSSLTRLMTDWHHELAAVRRIEAIRARVEAQAGPRNGVGPAPQRGAWSGSTLQDWEWRPSARETKAGGERFVIHQLNTAEELVSESSAMHHCVSTYASKCIAGHASIWALRRVAHGKTERMLTIEVDRQHRAVQVRGFANRMARADEINILERWAKARGIDLP